MMNGAANAMPVQAARGDLGEFVPLQRAPGEDEGAHRATEHPVAPVAPVAAVSTVLVADPGGVLGESFRPALSEHAGCNVLQAGSLTEVNDLVSSGVKGELALVSVGFHGTTPVIVRTLRSAGWARVLALTTSAVAVALVLDTVQAGATGVLSVAGCADVEPDPRNPAQQLSARELEVVRLVADGWSNKAIGRQLSLSSLTVKNHLARIGRKFGVGDRAHIVAIACRGGVIPGLPVRAYGPDRGAGAGARIRIID